MDEFAPIRHAVIAEGTLFSGSEVFAQLPEVEAIIREIGTQFTELAQVLRNAVGARQLEDLAVTHCREAVQLMGIDTQERSPSHALTS